MKDAEWIADLLKSRSERERELRELVRYRRGLIRDKALRSLIECTKCWRAVASVATTTGRSGRDMLRAMIAGEDDPNVLAEMARGRLRNKLGELRWALEGTMGSHQRFMLSAQDVGGGDRAPR